ncbi:DciA family protein [Propionivibrio limicola]|uniref:DciA family protein n=1 Tax=Propionivibrio limicola TaxID=167645 RepID=UPI001290FC6B|nr:DciA family protein [Propionivibrio limicola]
MPNTLDDYLDTPDGATKVIAHARLLMKLAHLYQQLAPAHLAQSSSLANYKSGTIVIHANSGAVAAKLRQLAPTLTAGFIKKGIECNGVQVKVHTALTDRPLDTCTLKPLSAATSRTLDSLRETLPGDSPLRTALAHLLDRAAKKE